MTERLPGLALYLMLGGTGGFAAAWVGLPLPYLIGALVVCAVYAMQTFARTGRQVWFPKTLRHVFVAVIGTMIGSTFSPGIFQILPLLWLSMGAVVLYVVAALAIGYVILRRLGGYDRPTALYGAMPGGLVDSVVFGEQAGGNVQILTVTHFARIIVVIIAVPGLFWLFSGTTVGSAAGQAFERGETHLVDVALLILIAGVGLMAGQRLRLPAAMLTGPLILSAGLHASGLLELSDPAWLLNGAQLVVGAGLGAQFSGARLGLLARSFVLTGLMVGLLIALGAGFAAVLSRLMPIPFSALFISFAPGGVTEMGLVALSLKISPVIVAAHHLFRIVLTVASGAWFLKRLAPAD